MNSLGYLLSSLLVFCMIGIQAGDSQTTQNIRRPDQLDEDCGWLCQTTRECIKSDEVCDGKVDCPDGTDESDSCNRIRCPAYLFRCDYGACINKVFKCDGKVDCRDGSDEAEEICTLHTK